VNIRFADRPPAAATRVEMAAAGGRSERFAAALPVLVRLAADPDPRRAGAALAPLLPGCPSPLVVDIGLQPAAAADFAYGLRLRAFRPLLKYRSRPDDDAPPPLPAELVMITPDPAAAEAAFARHEAVARGVFLARDLVAEPGNHLGPADLAERARLLEALGIGVEILDPAALGLGLLAAVGQGSARPSRLVVARWNGDPTGSRPLVLVGKGITFDAGGLSIKPAAHMDEMKGDMAGAAAVLGALTAIAGRRAKANVVGVLAVAENMPGGGALRPGDVVRSYGGRTVEVIDADAEGRLVLADALAWACATLEPAALVDIATLTGSVVRVLGHHHAGLYANRETLAHRLLTAGTTQAEPLWRLPLSAACDEHLRSDIADWKNCGWGALPDNDDAARFLQKFVDASVPWAHLDIAGTAEAPEDAIFSPKGATGFGVRLFDALAGG
jgi:leucyl aminopeptidase